MKTDLWRDCTERYDRHKLEFQALNPDMDFTTKYGPSSDYADETIYPIETAWRKEQDKIEVALRQETILVLGDIVEFRHEWSSPACNIISKRTLGVVTEDWAILGPDDQNSVGLDFLHEYHRTIGTEYLNKVQFLASDPNHVALRVKFKEVKEKNEKQKLKQLQDWITYQKQQDKLKCDANNALSHISC